MSIFCTSSFGRDILIVCVDTMVLLSIYSNCITIVYYCQWCFRSKIPQNMRTKYVDYDCSPETYQGHPFSISSLRTRCSVASFRLISSFLLQYSKGVATSRLIHKNLKPTVRLCSLDASLVLLTTNAATPIPKKEMVANMIIFSLYCCHGSYAIPLF